MLRTNQLDEQIQQQGLETIERSARSQSQLINDLLDVSRILTGKMRMELRLVELGESIESAVNIVLPSAQAKNIGVNIEIDRDAGLIAGDASRLSQIFWNLLTNAVKFTPKGGHISVMMKRATTTSGGVVQISDSGQGISPEFLPHVFERFRQADASTTRSFGGLGIGLALVRHLVEAHGGAVAANSEGEGQGSTFTLTFPMAAVRSASNSNTPDTPHLTSVPLSDENDSLPSLAGLHILVVDDEADARALIRLALEQRGAHVAVAPNAKEAFDLVLECRNASHPFDVLVSDIGMPEEDGNSLIQRIRHEEEQGGVQMPAIALTAYATHKDRMKALLAGFQNHIPKPVEPTELVATIASLTGRMGGSELKTQ